MSNHRSRWHEKRRRQIERQPWIRLDDVEVESDPKGDGYRVMIKGFNLRPAIVPPMITVGDERLTDVEFDPDGRQIVGHLKECPTSLTVVVDMGFARAEWLPEEAKEA
jgi:hypothetical protein